jgi:hypothetical protein
VPTKHKGPPLGGLQIADKPQYFYWGLLFLSHVQRKRYSFTFYWALF